MALGGSTEVSTPVTTKTGLIPATKIPVVSHNKSKSSTRLSNGQVKESFKDLTYLRTVKSRVECWRPAPTANRSALGTPRDEETKSSSSEECSNTVLEFMAHGLSPQKSPKQSPNQSIDDEDTPIEAIEVLDSSPMKP